MRSRSSPPGPSSDLSEEEEEDEEEEEAEEEEEGGKQIKWRTGISSSHGSKYLDCALCHFHTDFPTVCNMHEDGKIRACILHSAGVSSILLSGEARVTVKGHFYSLSPKKTGRMKHDVLVKRLNHYSNIRMKCR